MGRGKGQKQAPRPEPYVIKDVATLKAVADPLRHRLLIHLDRPRSVKELAAAVERPPDRLYYHLGLLERQGIIRSTAERGAERRFELVNTNMVLDPGLALPRAQVTGLITSMLQQAQREYAAAVRRRSRDGRKRARLVFTHLHLTEAEREELNGRMEALLADYDVPHESADDPERKPFGVLLGIWPVEDPAG
jgi:DNA-binding transcriptional ArsR family regulator